MNFPVFLRFSLIIVAAAILANAAPTPEKVIVLKAARLFDGKSKTLANNGVVVVQGDKIVDAGANLPIPPNAQIIDLGDATLSPGFMDAHTHVTFDYSGDYNKTRLGQLSLNVSEHAIRATLFARATVEAGFTTVRDACEYDPAYGQFALRDSVRIGLVQGPRMVAAGSCISVTGGHADADSLAPDQALPRRPNIADTVNEISTVTRRDLKYGADWIKLMATGGVADPLSDFNVQELSEEQMRMAVEIAHRARRRVMAHAEGTEGIKAAVRAGVDSVEHGTMLDEEGAMLMAKRGTWLVPTLNTFQRGVEVGLANNQDPIMLEKGKAILKYQQPAFALALKYHLKIAFGDDDDPEFAIKEFDALVRGGMKPLEALQAATINSAELLGLSDQVGAIEPGKLADIIAVNGNPLLNISAMEQVVFVMKSGEVIKNSSNANK